MRIPAPGKENLGWLESSAAEKELGFVPSDTLLKRWPVVHIGCIRKGIASRWRGHSPPCTDEATPGMLSPVLGSPVQGGLGITYTWWALQQCHRHCNLPLLCHLKLHLCTASVGSLYSYLSDLYRQQGKEDCGRLTLFLLQWSDCSVNYIISLLYYIIFHFNVLVASNRKQEHEYVKPQVKCSEHLRMFKRQ